MKVDLVASLPHYRSHLLPIWDALPEALKGTIHPQLSVVEPCAEDRVALVGGWADVQPLRGRCKMIYVEHGAGQTYAGDPKFGHLDGYSASGGRRHQGVIGFIAPSDNVAARWQTAPAEAVGCPKMDPWHNRPSTPRHTVCFAFHWDCMLVNETRSAWDHYSLSMPDIVENFAGQGWVVYGHAHPRWNGQLDDALIDAGMEIIHSDREVFNAAEILIVDNSSIGYEFASLDRPVVWLNAPWYRRDVNHGLRFWSHVIGPMIDTPDFLAKINLAQVVDEHRKRLPQYRRMVRDVYKYVDGRAAERAAAFVTQLVSEL